MSASVLCDNSAKMAHQVASAGQCIFLRIEVRSSVLVARLTSRMPVLKHHDESLPNNCLKNCVHVAFQALIEFGTRK